MLYGPIMLIWSVAVAILGVAATVWAFATNRDHGPLQLGALVGGSTLAFGGIVATLIVAASEL